MRCLPSIVFVLWIMSSFQSSGQDRIGATSTISVSGAKQVIVEPSRLRLQLEMQTQGRNAVDAMKGIADHRQKVKEAFSEMKADLSSLEFSSTTLIVGTPGLLGRDVGNRANGMFFELADDPFGAPNNVRPAKNEEEENELPRLHFASEQASVEWTLPTKDLDALMVLPETLKSQIKKRDLKGRKNRVKLNDEEKDLIMSELRKQGMTGEEPDGDDEVDIRFVGIISDVQYKAALREGFNQAKKEATILAEATGQKLGKVIKVDRVQIEANNDGNQVYQSYGMSYQQQVQVLTAISDREITSTSAERMKAKIRIHVVFAAE